MRDILRAFGNWRMFLTLLLGFSSGLPLALVGGTLQAWMKTEGVDLKTIGLFSLVGLPYTLKFVWSPIMDRFVPGFLGRRRGWMLITQVAIIGAIVAMAFSSPGSNPGMVAALALSLAFFSASQDIVLDAFRVEFLKTEEYGAGSGVNIMGYRLAMITSSGLALILADHMSWQSVYLIMAASMAVGLIATLSAREPETRVAPPKNLREALVNPFFEFFSRPGSIEILAFIILYKLGDVFAASLSTAFLLDRGYTKTEIGAVIKIFGIWASIAGSLLGGAALVRFGLRKSLWIFGVLQAVSTLVYLQLSLAPNSTTLLTWAISVENITGGMGTAALVAFLMNLCNKKFTATQFALLSSLTAVARVIAGAPSGYAAEAWGWPAFFIFSTLLAIPGLLLLLRFPHWAKGVEGLDSKGMT